MMSLSMERQLIDSFPVDTGCDCRGAVPYIAYQPQQNLSLTLGSAKLLVRQTQPCTKGWLGMSLAQSAQLGQLR